MKRQTILYFLYGGWLVTLIIVIIAIFYYIDNKSNRLHQEIWDNIHAIFKGQEYVDGPGYITVYDGYFDVAYNDRAKHYKRIPVPSKPDEFPPMSFVGKSQEQLKEQWIESYGDLSSLYALNWDDDFPNKHDEGWAILRICCGGGPEEIIQTNVFFPYQVGFKRTEWGNFYTVEDAIADAYEFYTTNDESAIADRFEKGSLNRIWSKIYSSCNEYYGIVKNEHSNSWIRGIPIVKNVEGMSFDEIQRIFPYENGWMHNRYYRVFIATTQEETYRIEKFELAINKDRKTLLLWWCLGISMVFLGLIIPLTIIHKKSNQRKKESLYERLCRLCNPQKFVTNYDKEKLDTANIIYKSLMQITSDNEEELAFLANRAVSELGISIIDKTELMEMREKANPANYMKPYDPEKVSIANEAYSLIEKGRLSYKDYIHLKSLLNKL